MAVKETMRYAIELGFDGKDAERDSKKTFDNIGDNAEKSTGRFEGLGGKMGKALVAGFAAVGVGAIIVDALNASGERAAQRNLLQGQMNLTAKEAERYGKLAGELYADGFGTSVVELQEIAARSVREFGAMSDAELSKISSSVAAVSKTFGEDFDAVIRSTSQLLENNLAPSAEAALDLIVAAFQEGGNEAGDLLDTIDEYSQHWAAMGLSGEDALNQIVHGMQNGQRDADKLADAVKEMRIRVVDDSSATADAYKDLGLNAERLRGQFLEGGEAAREAFQEVIAALQGVEDPYERNRLAIALIGTQFEDLGPKALDSLASIDGALEETTGRAEDLATVVQETDWTKLKREGEQAYAGFGDLLAKQVGKPLSALNDVIDGTAVGYGKSILGMKGNTVDLADSLVGLETAAGRAHGGLGKTFVEADPKARALGASLGTLDSELGAIRDSSKKAAERLEDVGEAAEDSADFVDDLTEAFAGLRDEISDRSAYRDLQNAFDQVESSAKESWEAATSGAEDAERKARDHAQAVDDLRGKVIDYSIALGDVPPETVSRIQALIDQDRLAEAEAALERLARNRDAVIRARTIISESVRTGSYSSGSTRTTSKDGTKTFGATGGIVNRRTDNVTLGEAGPEVVIPLDKTPGNSPLGGLGLGGGATFNLTVNAGMGANGPEISRVIVDEIRKFERRNGPGWRQ